MQTENKKGSVDNMDLRWYFYISLTAISMKLSISLMRGLICSVCFTDYWCYAQTLLQILKDKKGFDAIFVFYSDDLFL